MSKPELHDAERIRRQLQQLLAGDHCRGNLPLRMDSTPDQAESGPCTE